MRDVSILIPVYNAALLIHETHRRLCDQLSSMGLSFEIIYCDDGSVDESSQILKNLAVSEGAAPIKCLFNDRNRGLGFTLRRMLAQANGKFLVYLDCDLPFGTEVLPVLLKEVQGSDVALASRYQKGRGNTPFLRWIVSRGYAVWCRFLFGIHVSDIGSGSVALRRDFIQKLSLISDGFTIHAEIFLQTQRQQGNIREFYFPAASWQSGSFSIFKHGAAIIRETLQLWDALKRGPSGKSSHDLSVRNT